MSTLNALFAALREFILPETACLEEAFAAPVCGAVAVYNTTASFDQDETVVYTISSGKAGEGRTSTGRVCHGLEGGMVVGPSRGGSTSSPMLNGYLMAIDGDTRATVHGVAIRGHSYPDGLYARFGVELNLSQSAYNALARAIRGKAEFQLRITALRGAYGVNNKKFNPDLGGEFTEYVYGRVREMRSPVEPIRIEVLYPGHPEWVVPTVEAVSRKGVYGTGTRAQARRAADLAQVFANLGTGASAPVPTPTPTAATAAPTQEPAVTPAADATADAEAQALLDQLMGQAPEADEPDLG
jgi:hypothetical protein